MGLNVGIPIGTGKRRRDWSKIAYAAAEATTQALALGAGGFSGAVSAFFRTVEGLRGEDDVELRATTLVTDTLAYATAATIARARLARKPMRAESQAIVESVLRRAGTLSSQSQIEFTSDDLKRPATFSLFEDGAKRAPHDLRRFTPQESNDDLSARFRESVAEGLTRIRTRRPEYFSEVIDVLTGPETVADSRVRAWNAYRALLVRRFEDEPLFGEELGRGVSIAQVYQPLRCWWNEVEEEFSDSLADARFLGKTPRRHVHLVMLELAVEEWLKAADREDCIRFVSGGPGSGKSTFAKRLASLLANRPKWRILYIPLQRLRGIGSLETRIDEYYRLHADEPFVAETSPTLEIGSDRHHDWLFIFDGLDELAKEGTGSESAAQDFASALADMRARLSTVAAVRYIVLGRAPSMQEARRRLGLHGSRTLHVADMAPLDFDSVANDVELVVHDPFELAPIDQRQEFWARWAIAKGLPLAPPEAMKVKELSDLTKEPLLAYLLIKSGYASERWRDAAQNRNRIYHSIFNEIWERERAKETRTRLNDIGKLGFDSLMQCLGIAAWRGGGRTGDEDTFTEIRDIFMRPDLLAKAKSSGAAELNNVAVLFYTQRDEHGGRGYEFLHKSFGEYLTACGLLSALQRWGHQVESPEIDFDATAFLKRWLVLSGPAAMTFDICTFLGNEVRLQAEEADCQPPWAFGRRWIAILQDILHEAIVDGIPAHEGAETWRKAEAAECNAEHSLLLLVNACAKSAYPSDLVGADATEGGWEPGSIKIAAFQKDSEALNDLLRRLKLFFPFLRPKYYGNYDPFLDYSRYDFSDVFLYVSPQMDLYGVRLDRGVISGHLFRVDLASASLVGCRCTYTHFFSCNLSNACFCSGQLENSSFEDCDLRGVDFGGANLAGVSFHYCDLGRAKFVDANLEGASFEKSEISDASFEGARLAEGALSDALTDGETLAEARALRDQRMFNNQPPSLE